VESNAIVQVTVDILIIVTSQHVYKLTKALYCSPPICPRCSTKTRLTWILALTATAGQFCVTLHNYE